MDRKRVNSYDRENNIIENYDIGQAPMVNTPSGPGHLIDYHSDVDKMYVDVDGWHMMGFDPEEVEYKDKEQFIKQRR